MCTVPRLVFAGNGNKITVTEAETSWRGAGFRQENFSAARPPMNDYKVGSQTESAGASLPCLTTTIQVGP
jgi:hypothetical protein